MSSKSTNTLKKFKKSAEKNFKKNVGKNVTKNLLPTVIGGGAAVTSAFSFADYFDSNEIRQWGEHLVDRAEAFIRKHPLQFIGSALAAGLIVGFFFSEKPLLQKLTSTSLTRH